MAHHEPEQYLVSRLQDAFARDPRVAELSIAVDVSGRDIYLSGSVSTAERSDVVAEVAKELCPEHSIHNDLTVAQVLDEPAVEDLD
ncbi:MAG: BON domain-containing protein [Actinomycetota bacterium]